MCFPVGWCCFRNVWYIQGVGSSKSTGSKLCYPVKCGWICINCHKVHRNKEAVLAQECLKSTGHKMVESPLMCNHCFGLGDDMHKIKATICPKALDFTSSDMETPTEVPPPVLPMQEKVHAGMVETKTSRIKQDMEAVQMEIKRLQILREMQVERERLASLIAKKRQATSHLSEWGKVITIGSTWYANTFFSEHTYISCSNRVSKALMLWRPYQWLKLSLNTGQQARPFYTIICPVLLKHFCVCISILIYFSLA